MFKLPNNAVWKLEIIFQHWQTFLSFWQLTCFDLINNRTHNYTVRVVDMNQVTVQHFPSLSPYDSEQEAHQLVGLGKTPRHSTLKSGRTFNVSVLVILRQTVGLDVPAKFCDSNGLNSWRNI